MYHTLILANPPNLEDIRNINNFILVATTNLLRLRYKMEIFTASVNLCNPQNYLGAKR